MNREEAIDVLSKYKRYAESIYTDGFQDSKAFDLAIAELSHDRCDKCFYKRAIKDYELFGELTEATVSHEDERREP